MLGKGPLLAEGSASVTGDKGLYCVISVAVSKVGALGTGGAPVVTDTGFSALNCLVSPNVRAVSNGSSTLTAFVGVAAGVDPRVLAKGVAGLNAFP